MNEISRDEQVKNIVKGLETTLTELKPRLTEQVDGMTTKQLRRALKASINFITTKTDDTDVNALGESEKEFLGGIFAAVEARVHYSLHIISEIQREEIQKQNDAEKAKGEVDEA